MKFKSALNRILGRDSFMEPQLCYAQEGEDLLLNRFLEGQEQGFYVDVGAHHPVRFSNTYMFYKRGWRGINIDAMPGSMKKFNQVRPRDINLECGVASDSATLKFYRFNEPALNTFSQVEADLKNKPPYALVDTVDVPVEPLDVLLTRHVPDGQQIDFLSVDVEGKDEEVLRSNDWQRYRPRFVLAETLRTDILGLNSCPIVKFLAEVGYKPIAKAYNTSFFERT